MKLQVILHLYLENSRIVCAPCHSKTGGPFSTSSERAFVSWGSMGNSVVFEQASDPGDRSLVSWKWWKWWE